MKNSILVVLILLLIPSIIFNQDWKKVIKNKVSKQVNKIEKKIIQEVKPLDINFKIAKIGYNPLKSLNKLNLTIDFTGNNPNPMGLTLNKTEFNLFVNEKLVSKFFNEKKIIIPKNDVFSFQEKAEITILEAGKTIFNSMLKKNAIYSLMGKYFVDTSIGSFAFDIKLMEKEMNPKNK